MTDIMKKNTGTNVYWYIFGRHNYTNESYIKAVRLYNKAMGKQKQQARKLIILNRILQNTCLNSDIASLVCSFLTGVKGSVAHQLKTMKTVFEIGNIPSTLKPDADVNDVPEETYRHVVIGRRDVVQHIGQYMNFIEL